MPDYAKNLGISVYKNRKRLKMTQSELAEKAGVTEQTIRKIEHGEGNPQLEVLYALITSLKIDPEEIFYPKTNEFELEKKQLDLLLADCSVDQIQEILPVVEAALKIVKGRSIITNK